jgi:selenocysteine-specific elongation factor
MGDTPTAPTQPPLTLGTAGHIDHGKTALINVLTGYNTDRLPEERSRGISIELGYARLDLPSGRRVSVVDAPGHERFVRTMVAGATGIDLFLMVVAADDGVMPQTREHAAVLRGLAIRHGVVAVTKADLADSARGVREAGALLPDAEAVAVSSRTGEGLDELVAALGRVAARLPGRSAAGGGGEPRLHIDRVFTIRGAGTVVTGTLWSGSVARGDEVTVLPGDLTARVRAVQVHDEPFDRAVAGQRVALNLAGVSVDELRRGDVVSGPGAALAATYVLDAALELDGGERPVEHGARVQVHHGTREAPARLAELGGRFWQVRLEQPLVPAPGDRLVVRRIAPPDTLGGGVVLDPHARKHGPGRETLVRLTRLERGDPEPEPSPEPIPKPPVAEPKPLSPAALELEARLREAWLTPPIEAELGADAKELPALRRAGRAIRVGPTLHYHPDALAEAERQLRDLAKTNGEVTIAQYRDALNTSRKFAQALLEHFDGEKITRRVGDAHILRN